MKKIYLAILCVVGGMSLQSCLHDDKEFFDDSAANRIENTVEETQKILESSENGWELHYYTGSQYSGGGYTLLFNFHNGKVTVAGDPALATSTERVSSSYAVDRSMGPVLTFNTYNSILHKLGTPNINNIEGEQADWEFVVTKLTQDSIYVRGKKWGNDMVFSRLPKTLNWKEHLDSIGEVASKLSDNYVILGSTDASKAVEINSSTRRVASRNVLGQVVESPFIVTATGILSKENITVDNATTREFCVSKTGNIQMKGNESVVLSPYIAPIETWVGNWSLSAMAGSCDIAIAKSTEKADSLVGTFKVDTVTYHVGLTYDSQTGYLRLGTQDIEDPTGKYATIWFMGTDLSQSTLLGAGGINMVWHCVTQEASFKGEKVEGSGKEYTVDSFIGVAIGYDNQYVRDEKGNMVFPVAWYYLSSLSRN